MNKNYLLFNGRLYTQAQGLIVDSLAVRSGRIVAVGNGLEHDPDFRAFSRIDLKGRAVSPGLVDSHTHFVYFAHLMGTVDLDGLDSLDKCLDAIRRHADGIGRRDWLVGRGYSPERFRNRIQPTAADLDRVAGGRPAFMFSKDQHSAWVNTAALELAGISKTTKDPAAGRIERDADGHPTGILREGSAIDLVHRLVPVLSGRRLDTCYEKALQFAYRQGVTGTHSVDSDLGFSYLTLRAERNRVGLRINYYVPVTKLPEMLSEKVYYGTGTEFLRIAGVKMFTDGSLGSQTALCFNKYIGSTNNFGIEVMTPPAILKAARAAARLGLPCAIHAIGDRAVANVLDALEQAPRLDFGARHRIEHLQLIRRKDIVRLKRLGIVASMQPSHCPSDIDMIRRYWGPRGANAFVFRTLLDKGIPLAFGSDCPIEPLKPLDGIAAAVRRARPGSRDVFSPDERISAAEALHCYTAGAAFAVGQEHQHGCLLPGYAADFVVYSEDIMRVAASQIASTEILATVLAGKPMYAHSSLKW